MNESNLEWLLEYMLRKLQLTDCMLLGGENFHSRIAKMIPHDIGLHARLVTRENLPLSDSGPASLCNESIDDNKAISAADRVINLLGGENLEKTLVIADADIYLGQGGRTEDLERIRKTLQELPYCITAGILQQSNLGKYLGHQEGADHAQDMHGYSVFEDPVTKQDKGIWLKLDGKIFTPKTREILPALKIAAILIAYNEDDILEECIRILHNQGIDTYLIDDESTDLSTQIASRLTTEGTLTGYQRSGLSKDCDDRWSRLLEISFETASTIDADWIIHHDVDEVREAPWQGTTLADGIRIVDSLGFNCIDHTVIEYLFTEQDCESSPANGDLSPFNYLKHFRFPSHKPNFMQLKAWRKEDQLEPSAGGHKIALKNPRIFPLKFLIKHYPLRSLNHAKKKMLQERLTRFSAERARLGWHNHYHYFQYFGVVKGWTRRELHLFNPSTFYQEFIIERLTGCGLEQTERPDINMHTLTRIIELQEEFRAQLASALEIDLSLAKLLPKQKGLDLRNYSWSVENDTILKTLNSRFYAHKESRQELAALRQEMQEVETAIYNYKTSNSLADESIFSVNDLLKHAHLQLNACHSQLDNVRQAQAYQARIINRYKSVFSIFFRIFHQLVAAKVGR